MRFWNFLILLHYWRTIERARALVNDPKSKFSTKALEDVTTEELEGITDMEKIGRVLCCKPSELRKDLKHLKKVLQID